MIEGRTVKLLGMPHDGTTTCDIRKRGGHACLLSRMFSDILRARHECMVSKQRATYPEYRVVNDPIVLGHARPDGPRLHWSGQWSFFFFFFF